MNKKIFRGGKMTDITKLLTIMAQLRDPQKGCPWDVEQNFDSIAPCTLEEAYEVADAIARKDMPALKEELGDLLLQVVFHAQMAKEQKSFTFDDVVQAICDKLITRHPHVFGDDKTVKTADQQVDAWEKIKAEEKAKRGGKGGALDGVTLGLPALLRAYKLQKRAAKIGFDWPDVNPVLDKLDEEIGELRDAIRTKNQSDIFEELGDVLFVCVNIGKHTGVDAEEALRAANSKFERRFKYIEQALEMQKRDFADTSLQELDELWDQAKLAERSEAA